MQKKTDYKKDFTALSIGSSIADKYPPFPDGTLFINRKAKKNLWCVVDDGVLLSFDGNYYERQKAITHLNDLSLKKSKTDPSWSSCEDIEIIFLDGRIVRLIELNSDLA